jgi:CrcB protein
MFLVEAVSAKLNCSQGEQLPTHLKATALVFLGGALGSAARFSIGMQFGEIWMLFAVNLFGTGLLGFVNGKPRPEWATSLFGSGFAGGFTTMSGLSIVIALTSFAELAIALAFVFAMLGAGFASYLVGLRLAVIRK